ncbi:N-acetylglucosaminyl-phosphatidylinositol de-N-acetylase [Colletotrichum sp. SAR 10_70]|nr:N-acetylglucosaminyl-phosphatidylinositol de-N-acetylase [Colletotrichum sp. SAR 10_71]KAI8180022.1 N-acetylglucosaminyl-phosphatidylinositol de-N-acetylase [Colletotrichum sp. SAR 10_70]
MDSLLVGALIVAVTPALYICLGPLAASQLPALENKRVCLLIAHPDDEAMFFAPTVLALTRPETGNHVKILCLSSGDADGLGETRKKELVKSGMKLGLRQEQDVFVIDSPDFRDSMTATWDKTKVATLLNRAFAPHSARQRAAGEEPDANIDILITFDSTGVSSHPNHISLYHGARTFISTLTDNGRWRSPVDMYTLTSVNFLRKYSTFLDAVPTILSWAITPGSNPPKPPKKLPKPKKEKEDSDDDSDSDEDESDIEYHPSRLVFMNNFGPKGGYSTAWAAMTMAHKSQMVWFRYGWITLSRYMVINDLRLEKVEDMPPVEMPVIEAPPEAKRSESKRSETRHRERKHSESSKKEETKERESKRSEKSEGKQRESKREETKHRESKKDETKHRESKHAEPKKEDTKERESKKEDTKERESRKAERAEKAEKVEKTEKAEKSEKREGKQVEFAPIESVETKFFEVPKEETKERESKRSEKRESRHSESKKEEKEDAKEREARKAEKAEKRERERERERESKREEKEDAKEREARKAEKRERLQDR